MAITRVGSASVEATTITIPAAHQSGDLIIIFAFQAGTVTNPTVPAGFTTLTNASDGTLCCISVAWKIAASNAETSGTWTGTTGLVCMVYRGQATNKTPVGANVPANAGASNTINYPTINTTLRSSWLVGFAGHTSLDTTIETAPANMVNQTDTVGATAEYAGHDTNGPLLATDGWPSTNVTVTGTANNWMTFMVQVLADEPNMESYKFIKVGNGMSTSEKLR